MIKSVISAICTVVPLCCAHAADITINRSAHTLAYTDDSGNVQTYSVGVGRQPSMSKPGTYTVVAKQMHPCWTPTPNMVHHGARNRTVCGAHSPLGVARLKLDRGFLGIHGTTDENSVGHNASHGCFRMHRDDILQLYHSVPVGTRVNVQ